MVKISEWYNKGLFLLTLYFVLDCDFEYVILFILNLYELI